MNKLDSSDVDSLAHPEGGNLDRTMGPWSIEENVLYVSFLELNRAVMSSKRKRRQLKIFDQMSEFIGTRNPLQCRSHHQKLLEKMGDFKVIIKNFKKNVGKKYFKEQYRQCLARTPIDTICPSVKEQEDSPETERVSPLVAEAVQAQDNSSFLVADIYYLQEMRQQLLASMLMMPCYYHF